MTSGSIRAALVVAVAVGCVHSRPQPRSGDAIADDPPVRSALVVVSNEGSNDLTVIDAATLQVVKRIPVGKRPRGIRASADGRRVFVALSGSPRAPPGTDESKLPPPDRSADGIAVVDVELGKVLQVLESGSDPETFDLSLDEGRVYVSNEDAGKLSTIDVLTGRVLAQVGVGGEPEGVTVRPDGAEVWVTCEESHEVHAIDTRTHEVVAVMPVGLRPRSILFTADGKRAFVANEVSGDVTVLDAHTHEKLATIPIGVPAALPMHLTASADGARVYVSLGRHKGIAEIDPETFEVVRTIPDVGTRPWGIALTPDGSRLFSANGPSGDVSVIELTSGEVIARIESGALPWGVVVIR